jgi:hypothetical protein
MKDEIILYQSDELPARIEVRVENETVWLNLKQISMLFKKDKSVISRHIRNTFNEGELLESSVVAKITTTAEDGKNYQVKYYNLDVVISVGYRVKSKQGTQFRIWANKVLKDHLLKGYTLNNRINRIEDRVETLNNKIDDIDLQIRLNALPTQGIFFDGQIFDAYTFVSGLIRKAGHSLILIDNYIDDSVLNHFIKRKDAVEFTIYTKHISKQLKLDLEKHNMQYSPVKVGEFKKTHDRFLIIDENEIYHFGASLKDLGKKWFAFSKLHIDPEIILKEIRGVANQYENTYTGDSQIAL